MEARRKGRIVNIASGGGARAFPCLSAYVTSKTALIRFSECLAAEVEANGVHVFAIGPGTVRTAILAARDAVRQRRFIGSRCRGFRDATIKVERDLR